MLVVGCCGCLAVFLIEVDTHVSPQTVVSWPRLFGAGAAGSPRPAFGGRHFDDHRGDHVLDDDRHAFPRLDALHAAHSPQFHAESRESNRTGHIHQDFYLLSGCVADDSRPG